MKSFSHRFELLNVNTENIGTINLRVIINRKSKRYNLKIKTPKLLWSKEKQRILSKQKKDIQYNLVLKQYETDLNQLDIDLKMNKDSVDFDIFESKLFAMDSKDTFCAYARAYMKHNDNKYGSGTQRAYKAQIKKLENFNPNLKIKELDVSFLDKYFNHLLSINNKNTAYKAMAFVKVICRDAIKNGLLTRNPFDNFQIKSVEGKREFLTTEELNQIQHFYETTNDPTLKNVAKYFLFSCYTGLRYSDIKALQRNNIVNDIIEIKQIKTKSYISIPLNKKAQDLIEEKNQVLLFKVHCNQVTNRYLKDISEACKINKRLSFHASRHTFAMIAIGLDIPIEVISKIMGHRDLKTTQIYSKILDSVKLKHLSKFDAI